VEMANATATTPAGGGRRGGRGGAAGNAALQGRILAMLLKEGAALAISPTANGDTGTIFVSQVALPTPATNAAAGNNTNAPAGRGRGPTYYSTNAPATPPQIMISVEDYGRLVRMIKQGTRVKISADLDVKFYSKDTMAYNTVAEIPGTDLKDQLVMLG